MQFFNLGVKGLYFSFCFGYVQNGVLIKKNVTRWTQIISTLHPLFKVAMVIIDGKQTTNQGPYTEPITAGQALKDIGVHIHVVGVGQRFDENLTVIATDTNKSVSRIEHFKDLDPSVFLDDLGRICETVPKGLDNVLLFLFWKADRSAWQRTILTRRGCMIYKSDLWILTLSLPSVINIKFPLQPHQKYKITQYGGTWLFIVYSNERLYLPILTTSHKHFCFKGWENVLFELGSDRVKPVRVASDYSNSKGPKGQRLLNVGEWRWMLTSPKRLTKYPPLFTCTSANNCTSDIPISDSWS